MLLLDLPDFPRYRLRMQPESKSPDADKASAAGSGPASSHGPSLMHVWDTFQTWWHTEASGTVDQAAVIAKRRAECALTARYLLMVSMSAGIAILGLLLSSPAVVIGAMLLSPLMDPIMGVGFSLAIGDYKWLRQSAKSLAIGTGFAIMFCAVVVFMSPLQNVTSEIAARTRPNLFDLLVAIFSAIAGAYAMIRGREGTIVGVAIATALMPPLAVVGFGLATFNWTVFSGALLLFVTNLTAIALTATAMARAYGFSSSLSERGSQLQSVGMVVALVVLAVPLGLSLQTIAWETQAQRVIRDEISTVFEGKAEDVDPKVEFSTGAVQVSATVYTNELFDRAEVEGNAARQLESRLGRPVSVTILQIQSADAREAELAQLGESRQREAESLETAGVIAERLALLAGVPTDQVTVDRDNRRAMVRARPLDGANLAAYAELERRIDATEPAWDIRFEPPPLALPSIGFQEVTTDVGVSDTMTSEGRKALALVEWAQRRKGLPILLSGPTEAVEDVRKALADDGVAASTETSGSGYGTVRVEWDMEQ
ncbi:TIGR00341 family protein [Aurantiacibacter flavus]|uniref:TIGR00341 family protein n=1 Tax=Aurantiacibacter flavus TaxID=3145232 RepID=A0ABV0CY02_9SPHN